MRENVIINFTRSKNNFFSSEFLKQMDAQYKLDAYPPLSAGGYRIRDKWINKAKSGIWKPEGDDTDSKNAFAARYYWQAFQTVKKSVSDMIGDCDSAEISERDLPIWHSEMFMPYVTAGIINPSDMVGYCSHQVYIRNPMYTPLTSDILRDTMTVLPSLQQKEPEASVRMF